MTAEPSSRIIARAQLNSGVCAGMARVRDVLGGRSYAAFSQRGWENKSLGQGGESLLVIGLHHPAQKLELDWWTEGSTEGNRILAVISLELVQWLSEQGLSARALPYQLKSGGVFLKDAAACAGLGVVGRNNLFLHPRWGPRIRLRAILIEEALPPSEPLASFSPCADCDDRCHKACPKDAFPNGLYSRQRCQYRMEADEEHEDQPVIRYCRACELACPVGAEHSKNRGHSPISNGNR